MSEGITMSKRSERMNKHSCLDSYEAERSEAEV
jgi:hypothetical protein